MPTKPLKQIKGSSLIEVVCAIVILSFAMGGVYMGLMAATKNLFKPEELFEAMNIVSFYQAKVDNIDIQLCSSFETQSFEKNICNRDGKLFKIILEKEDYFNWAQAKTLEIQLKSINQNLNLYEIEYHLKNNEITVLKSTQWKVL